MNIETAIAFATERHKDQQYADRPYTYHLAQVDSIVQDCGFTQYLFRAAAWLHDVLEDTDTQYAELATYFGKDVADMVEACSGRGVNRKARELNINTKLMAYPAACLIKTPDRIANTDSSIKSPKTGEFDIGKARMYLAERETFTSIVKPNIPPRMMTRLDANFDNLTRLHKELT